MGDYVVRCAGCMSKLPLHALTCPLDGSLPRAEYSSVQLKPRALPGIWKFHDWLPVTGIIEGAGEGSVTYKSTGLAAALDLDNLYISFSGYWPERNARMRTCSFKGLEAPPTMQRKREMDDKSTMVVASAGNTARAFAEVASITGQKLVLVVPESAISRLWVTVEPGPVIVVGVDGDYYQAIEIADRLTSCPGYLPEGGARNIARRDGMGTVMLQAALAMRCLPHHYFQAVGSGTGGISAWEAAMRLVGDGRFGRNLPRLHLAQNLPNAPIYYAWTGKEPGPVSQVMYDDVLFNRRPPYSVAGGVKDALEATDGRVYGVTDWEAAMAKALYEESEGIDILNAPAVAIAALVQAVESRLVSKDDIILLNITGGGVARLKEEMDIVALKCDIVVSDPEELMNFMEGRA